MELGWGGEIGEDRGLNLVIVPVVAQFFSISYLSV